MIKRLKKYSIFLIVILCSIGLIAFKNNFQKDYTELSVKEIQEKIDNKESFVLTFTNIPATNELTYSQTMLFSEPNQDVITMNKYNRDYVSKNRKVIYYNTDIYSKEDEIKKIFNDLFKDVHLEEINFDNIPVTVWIEKGAVLYAGIGQTSEENYLLLTDKIMNNSTKKLDTSKIKFEVTKTSEEETQDTENTETKENTDNSSDKKTDDKPTEDKSSNETKDKETNLEKSNK